MMMFSKDQMIKRLEDEGKEAEITEEIISIMDLLDGKPVIKNDFKALIYDVIEYGVSIDGKFYEVNLEDCF